MHHDLDQPTHEALPSGGVLAAYALTWTSLVVIAGVPAYALYAYGPWDLHPFVAAFPPGLFASAVTAVLAWLYERRRARNPRPSVATPPAPVDRPVRRQQEAASPARR